MNNLKNYRYYLLIVPVFFVSCASLPYKNLECTYHYGGSTQSMIIKPVTDPYKVEAIQITFKNSKTEENANRTQRYARNDRPTRFDPIILDQIELRRRSARIVSYSLHFLQV